MSIKTPSLSDILNINTDKGSNLKFKDLQIACIVRGMDFKDVLDRDFYGLSNWLQRNVMVKEDLSKLEEYDNWMDQELLNMGKEELVHNSLRLGYIKREDEDAPVKTPKLPKEKKAPRERDGRGLYKGTKKSYTFDCFTRGKTLEQTLVKVKRKFPEAQDKSIRIWYNKAKKEASKK